MAGTITAQEKSTLFRPATLPLRIGQWEPLPNQWRRAAHVRPYFSGKELRQRQSRDDYQAMPVSRAIRFASPGFTSRLPWTGTEIILRSPDFEKISGPL